MKTRNCQLKRTSTHNSPKLRRYTQPRQKLSMEDQSVTCFEATPLSDFTACSQNTNVILGRKKRGITKKCAVKFTSNYKIITYQNKKYIKKDKPSQQLKFTCFQESELNIPENFATMLQKHKSDNDRDSDDEQITNAINYMQEDLFSCLKKEKLIAKKKKFLNRRCTI